MDSKLNPLQIVARAVSDHSSMTVGQVERALHDVLSHLMLRAHAELVVNSETDSAISLARQYQAVSEVVLFLGSQLIAFEDIEAEDDVHDECDPKN